MAQITGYQLLARDHDQNLVGTVAVVQPDVKVIIREAAIQYSLSCTQEANLASGLSLEMIGGTIQIIKVSLDIGQWLI